MGGAIGRILRLRAEDGLKDMLKPSNGYNGAGELVLPSRERVTVGEEVSVEISFGPMADEVTINAIVTSVETRENAAPLVTLYLLEAEAPRLRYVLDVLEGTREATARRYRRIPVDVRVRWWWGLRPYAHRAQGISFGGTFVRSAEAPGAGFRTEVEIRLDSKTAPLRIPSTVVWSGESEAGPGFGVQFKVTDPKTADGLRRMLRGYERDAATDVVALRN